MLGDSQAPGLLNLDILCSYVQAAVLWLDHFKHSLMEKSVMESIKHCHNGSYIAIVLSWLQFMTLFWYQTADNQKYALQAENDQQPLFRCQNVSN